MATVEIKVSKPAQGKLFPLSDSERAEKVEQLLGALNERDYLDAEKKEFLDGWKDQKADVDHRIASLREDLGLPESALGPQMRAAREENRREEI